MIAFKLLAHGIRVNLNATYRERQEKEMRKTHDLLPHWHCKLPLAYIARSVASFCVALDRSVIINPGRNQLILQVETRDTKKGEAQAAIAT